jgi:coenzyme F420 biosynthesis associated uncharacterized protein
MQLVDWDLAVGTATRLVPAGPSVTLEEAHAIVADLRALAVEAEHHVREFTGMDAPEGPDTVTVVDRPGWVRANVDGFRVVLEPLAEQLLDKRGKNLPAPGIVTAVGSRVTGAQVGLLLSYLATRVLGQYELFLPPGEGDGRLTLVAPNIVAVERALDVDPRDFRLWVCLHEVTHRTQFTAVPWLREHLRSEITSYLLASDIDASALLDRLKSAVGLLADSVRGRNDATLLDVVQTPEQKQILDRITGVMSLLEGHGEYVMDGVGPAVVPSVEEIRAKFEVRRKEAGTVERAVRRLLGIEMKMKQYAEGARFVREVVALVGRDGFNRVWTSPETLPTAAEIRAPRTWVDRVVGLPPAITA